MRRHLVLSQQVRCCCWFQTAAVPALVVHSCLQLSALMLTYTQKVRSRDIAQLRDTQSLIVTTI
jgi:hypothetical protein